MVDSLTIIDETNKSVVKDKVFMVKGAANNTLRTSDIMNDEILIPKDSVEILNELIPGVIIATEKLESSKTVMASVKINENTYVEYGKTQALAKQAVAESALKDLFFEQIKSTMFNDNDFQCNTNSWKLLGSLAMFKLIEDWLRFYMSNNKYNDSFKSTMPPQTRNSSNSVLSQNKNTETISKNNSSKKQDSLFQKDEDANEKKKQQSSINKNKTVDNSKKNSSNKSQTNKILTESTNACCLLNELVKSNFKYIDLQVNKDQPPFTFSLLVDGVEYTSDPSGSKKEAKQNVSKKVLIKKYGYKINKI